MKNKLIIFSSMLIILVMPFIFAHGDEGTEFYDSHHGMMSGFYGSYGMWGMSLFGWIFMLLIIVLLVLLIWWLIEKIQNEKKHDKRRRK